jgi:AcrR family transcriptional regulator
MPPIPDKYLEQRILNAALDLCRSRGERGLTLRNVARAAGTTTPTIYKRFHSKEALRLALARHIWQELIEQIVASSRIEETYRRYLRFSEAHPEEYKVLMAAWAEVFASERERAGEIWLLDQLANRFGGKPEEYVPVYYALLLLCHGAATFINMAADERVRTGLRENCILACDALIQHVDILRVRT